MSIRSNVVLAVAAGAASVAVLTFAAPPPGGGVPAGAAPQGPAFQDNDKWVNPQPP